VSEVVGPENLPNAISLNSAVFNSARLIGPGLAGVVISAFGAGWAILSNGISYLAFIAVLSIIDGSRLRRTAPVQRGKGDLDHTLYTVLADGSGKARVLYDATATPGNVAHDLRLLLES